VARFFAGKASRFIGNSVCVTLSQSDCTRRSPILMAPAETIEFARAYKGLQPRLL